MNWFEITGVVFGLLCVWLTTKQSIWNWPIGIINVGAFIVLFYQSKLYPDMCLHIVYLWLSIYGWAKWGLGTIRWTDKAPQLQVQDMTMKECLVWIPLVPVVSIVIGYLFSKYTQSMYPYTDSGITTLSLVAQFFMARKVLQSWLIWMVVDLAAIGLYATRGLYLTSALYVVYFILCIKGFNEWKTSKQA